MRSKIAVLLLAASTGCAAPRYLARVNEVEITGADLKREFKNRHAGHQSFLSDEISITSFVNKLIDHKLLVQEAYRLGLDEDPALKREVEKFRTARILERMAKVELDDKIRITDSEIQEIYDQKLLDILNVQQLVVPTKDEADAIREQLVAGADFETMVRERSTAPSRKKSGFMEVGWGTFSPEFEPVIFALPDGGLSPVMPTQDGYELIRVEKHTKLDKKPEFKAASNRIRGILDSRRRDALKKEVAAALWTKYQAKAEPFDDSIEGLRAIADAKPPSKARAASWTGGEVLLADFVGRLKLDALAEMPPETARRNVRQALENQVDPELLSLEGAARGYGTLPEIVDEVDAYRDSLVLNRFYEEFLVKGTQVTDDEVKAYYDAHQGELVTEEERHVAQIVLASPDKAEEMEKKLAAGESFEELARAHSKDTDTAKRGGILGWIKKSQATGDLAAVFELPQDAVAKPIKTGFGYHVFKVLEIRPEKPKPFEDCEAKLRDTVAQQKREAKRADWVKRLRDASTITVSSAGIRQFVKDNPLPDKLAARSMMHGPAAKDAGAAPGKDGAPAPAQAPASPAPASAPPQPAPAAPPVAPTTTAGAGNPAQAAATR